MRPVWRSAIADAFDAIDAMSTSSSVPVLPR